MKNQMATLLQVLKRTPQTLDAVYQLNPPMVDKRQPEIGIMYVRIVSTIDIVTGAGSVRVFESNDRGGAVSVPMNQLRGSMDGVFDHGFALMESGYTNVHFRAETNR